MSEEFGVDNKPSEPMRFAEAEEQKGLKRDLKLRHLTMIAISGTIGTGLFLTSGQAIATAGPGGALIAYILVGIWLVFVCQAIGEIATLLPVPGAFNSWPARFVDEAFAFQMAWLYWFSWAITIPAELSACGIVMQLWTPNLPDWVWPVVIIVFLILVNLIGVKGYGELEYWFSILKVITVIIFIICGILVDAGAVGGVTYGVSNWHITGAPFKGGFLGVLSVIVSAAFAYGGTELTGVTAAESENPHSHVPKAVNTVLLRIGFFYIVSVFLECNILANDDPKLLLASKSNVAVAPFTLILLKAGLNGAATYMNAVIFTSVVSACNSDFYASTRMLLSLARNGYAPHWLGYTNSRGVPIISLAINVVFAAIALVTIFVDSGIVFGWLSSVIGVMKLQSWLFIMILHFRFRYVWKAQGRPVKDLPYVAWGYPVGNILGTVIGVFLIIGNFYLSIESADPQTLFSAWAPWALSIVLYLFWKFYKKTKFVRAEEADLDTGRWEPADVTEEAKQEEAEKKWYHRIYDVLT